MSYDGGVSEREYRWDDEAKIGRPDAPVSRPEVIQALYSPLRQEVLIEDQLLYVYGPADSGRLIFVVADRFVTGINTFVITRARYASDSERRDWERRTR